MTRKENAINDFLKMIENSRTWERLTDDEKTRFKIFLNNSLMVADIVMGTYEKRQTLLCTLYYSFLTGCGYDGFGWRE